MKPNLSILLGATLIPLGLAGCGAGGKDAPPPHEASAPTGEKIEIKMNLAKGDKKELVANINIDMDIEAEGEELEMEMKIGMDMAFNVLDVDADGNHEMSFQFDRMKMLISGPSDIDYDSNRPGSSETQVGREIAPMIGYAITMKMTPLGETLEIGDLSDAPAALREQFTQSQDNLAMVATYPEKPVDNGDTWTLETSKTESGMKMDMKATYTLLEHKDGEALVGIQGDLTGGLKGWVHGDMKIDIATGWVKSATLKMKAAGEQNGAEVDMNMLMTYADS